MLESQSTADGIHASASDPHQSKPAARLFATTPRLLCVRASEPSWVHVTHSIHTAGLAPPRCVWVSSYREAVSRLREEPFDCILIDVPATGSFVRDDNGPFGLIRALRTSGCGESIVLVGRLFADAEWTAACEADCDLFVSTRGWDSPVLGAVIKRALARGELIRENARLTAAHNRRLVRDRDESEQLLAHQRQLIAELEALPTSSGERRGRAPNRDSAANGATAANRAETAQPKPATSAEAEPTHEFAERYSGLLRSYVLMGSGSLASEIAEMVDCFVRAGLPPPEALQIHLACVEKLVKGLGNRSARHVVSRADLLAIELMTHLAHRSQRPAATNSATNEADIAAFLLRNVTGSAGIDLSRR
jgi:hypothetical protein